jgi:DNA mismatch repair protein MutS2
MDRHALDLLDFDKIRQLVAGRAACALGKTEAQRIEPLTDASRIHHQQALTTEMVEAILAGLKPSFGGLHDIRPQVRRAEVGSLLDAEELAQVGETLRAISYLDSWIARIADQFPRLGSLREGVSEFSGLAVTIEGCLDSRGKVLDTASRRLSAIRREIAQVEEKVQETLRRLLRSPDIRRYLRYPSFSMVGHHYVLPVSKEHRGEISGAVHRTSASNETVYIEPTAIGEHSAQLSFLRERESKEIRRILRWLTAQVGQVAKPLIDTLAIMAQIDLIHARGRLSLDYRMSAPYFNQDRKLILRGARHPLLEALIQSDPALFKPVEEPSPAPKLDVEASPELAEPVGAIPETTAGSPPAATIPDPVPAPPKATRIPTEVTPIDLNLGVRFRTLVITGPNTGGKTVALKTVGLLVMMAQSGMHVPAREGSEFPIFDDVLADIGDEQSLEQSLSTFSAHVSRIAEVLATATPRSLVLMDELGAGTDPADGAALGRAILDELGAIGCSSIVTTHIGDLKTYALSNPDAENAAVEFDDETLQPRYRIHIGDIGQSNALKIARHFQLSEHVIARAEGYLAERKGGGIPDWEVLQKLRKEAEEAKLAAIQAQAEAERTRQVLADRLAQLQQEATNADNLADARARLEPGDRVVVPRLGYDRPGRIVKLDVRKKTAVVSIGHVTWNVTIDELIPQSARTPEAAKTPSPRPRSLPD